jgi:hypothetical protein
MKHLLPRRAELVLFAVIALACAAAVAISRAHDVGLFVCAAPIFAVSAWMGMRRSGQWAAISRKVTQAPILQPVEEETV